MKLTKGDTAEILRRKARGHPAAWIKELSLTSEIDGETEETVSDFIFWAPESLQMVIAALKLKDAYSLEGKLWPT